MKSPHRTHHSRVEVTSATVKQNAESYTVTVKFHVNPWASPEEWPIAYAADALTAVNAIIGAGVETLDKIDQAAAVAEWAEGDEPVDGHEAECLVAKGGIADFCICPELRAAELRGYERGLAEQIDWTLLPSESDAHQGYLTGYRTGIQTAQAAVAKQPLPNNHRPEEVRQLLLGAIPRQEAAQ